MGTSMIFSVVLILGNYLLCQMAALYKHDTDSYNKQTPFKPVFTNIL
jgi:hypothetical protein